MFQNEAVCLDSVFETPLNKSQIEVSERNKERKKERTIRQEKFAKWGS